MTLLGSEQTTSLLVVMITFEVKILLAAFLNSNSHGNGHNSLGGLRVEKLASCKASVGVHAGDAITFSFEMERDDPSLFIRLYLIFSVLLGEH